MSCHKAAVILQNASLKGIGILQEEGWPGVDFQLPPLELHSHASEALS